MPSRTNNWSAIGDASESPLSSKILQRIDFGLQTVNCASPSRRAARAVSAAADVWRGWPPRLQRQRLRQQSPLRPPFCSGCGGSGGQIVQRWRIFPAVVAVCRLVSSDRRLVMPLLVVAAARKAALASAKVASSCCDEMRASSNAAVAAACCGRIWKSVCLALPVRLPAGQSPHWHRRAGRFRG